MLPAYNYTEYKSPSGNTQIYIIRKKQPKPFIKRFLTDKRYALARQKILGLALVIIGFSGSLLFASEDTTAFVFCILLGILRIASN